MQVVPSERVNARLGLGGVTIEGETDITHPLRDHEHASWMTLRTATRCGGALTCA